MTILSRRDYVKQHLEKIDNPPVIYCHDCGQEMIINDERVVTPCCPSEEWVTEKEILEENLESMADHIDDLQDRLFIINTDKPTDQELEDAYNNLTTTELKHIARTLEYMKNLTGE